MSFCLIASVAETATIFLSNFKARSLVGSRQNAINLRVDYSKGQQR